jgi:calcyphosin
LEIKGMLGKRGTLGIRGLGKLFRIMDNNGNRQLDIREFEQGLGEMGVGLN